MNRELRVSARFKSDLKKLSHYDRLDVSAIVEKLRHDEPLAAKFRDHELRGKYVGYRECHVHPDLLLVYRKSAEGELFILTLYRIGSHANIF